MDLESNENSDVKLLKSKSSCQNADIISMNNKNGTEIDNEEDLFGDKTWVSQWQIKDI